MSDKGTGLPRPQAVRRQATRPPSGEAIMCRFLAVAVLVCAGCAGSQPVQRPSWVPRTDLLFQNADAFFDKHNPGDVVLPESNDTALPPPAR
jgi:hypothetical protein